MFAALAGFVVVTLTMHFSVTTLLTQNGPVCAYAPCVHRKARTNAEKNIDPN